MIYSGTRKPLAWKLTAVIAVVGALAFPIPASGQGQGQNPVVTESLLSFGSVWSYLDNGAEAAPDWFQPDFDDSAWASGPAELGYGDGDEATVLSFGPSEDNKYPAALFRRSFNVADLVQLVDARLSIERDDAAIVYLNGIELWRSSNLPAQVDRSTYATSVATEGVSDAVVLPLGRLVEGRNTVAVQIHNESSRSSDISFDLGIEVDRDTSVDPGPPMLSDEFAGPAGEVLSGTVAANDSAGLSYTVAVQDLPSLAVGLFAVTAGGGFTFTPAVGFSGTVLIPITGCNSANPPSCGARDLALQINGVVALDDEADTAVGESTSGSVAGNDASNGNGPLTWSLLTEPDDGDGLLTFATDGGWSFTPATGFEGTATVDYQACDAQGDCGQATLTILVGTVELAVDFSRERGYFTQPFALTITANDPNAQLFVSTEWGDEWLTDDFLAIARRYTGPIQVTDSMQVRVLAVAADGRRTGVESHSFIDLAGFSAQQRAVMESFPTFVSTADGLGERLVDARTITEYWHPDGDSTAAPAGIRNRQNGTGQRGDFRLYFRAEYGEGRLDFDLFPGEPAGAQRPDSWDKITFHGGSQDYLGPSWNSYNGCPIGDGTLMRDRYYQRLQRYTNGDGAPGDYYFMWHQDRLVGVKNGEEVPHKGFMEGNFGGEKDDYALWSYRSRELPSGNAYEAVDDADSFYDALDVTNYIDYLLVQWFSGNSDWASESDDNNVVIGGLADGPYYHWVWDSHSTSPGCERVWGTLTDRLDTPTGDADFRMDFADRVLLHFGPGGALTEANALARWDELAAELRPAVPLVADLDEWEAAQQNVRSQLRGTSGELLDWLEDAGLASTVSPVSYSIPAGQVASGTRVSLSGGSEIWFTIDGTDPRANGGAVSGAAQRYAGSVALPDGTVQMTARVRRNGRWSAARPMIYQVGTGPGLVINEIHFHPADEIGAAGAGGVEIDGDEYEFVELANLGSTAVDLEYFRLQGGVRFKFDYGRSPILAPGEFVVVAENAERFAQRYGFAPDGEYLDKLGNATDEIRLVDTELNPVDVVTYEDSWDPRADGNGASLSFGGEGDNSGALQWGRSASPGGTPGAPNVLAAPQAAPVPGMILNEWNAVSPSNALSGSDARLGRISGNGGDWFELVVVDDHVDARGWTIEVGDSDDTTVLTLSQAAVWSDLRSGTIITIAEQAEIVAAAGTRYAQDMSYDPAAGDWWIHAVAGDGGSGSFVTASNFAVTGDDWQATIRDDNGQVQWGPVGEGIGSLPRGVGNSEIGELEADPTTTLDPALAPYDDGDDSTFGLANVFGGVRQDLAALRTVVTPLVTLVADRVEVAHSVSCLAGNGRIDTNIINVGAGIATYRIELEGLSPRGNTVVADDWWRMSITGRGDGDYPLTVRRNGVVVSQETLTVACDIDTPQVTGDEIQIVNACRGGTGYILFQFVNPSSAARGWVIEFDDVVNRSTGTQGFGAAVRAVTGRPDGEHGYAIRVGFEQIASGTVTVVC